jgi:hypothetical protein
MLYVDVEDVARAFRAYAERILDGEVEKEGGSLGRVLSLFNHAGGASAEPPAGPTPGEPLDSTPS